jgi:DNA helicase HerA-like ATPase
LGNPPNGWHELGQVIGTALPIYLNLGAASEGHVAILGMTKMGKSTLADQIARKLGQTRSVTVLDLTGEYVGRKGYTKYSGIVNLAAAGISVFEPKADEVPAKRALSFLKHILAVATPEYQAGAPFPRTIIIDEAHQFIPEPAGLGFNAPGRDASFEIGLLMMQIRKYGVSMILISRRTAVVAKSALSQCENLIAFRSVDQTGLDYLEAVAGPEVRFTLPRLQQGQALAFGPAISSEMPVAIQVTPPAAGPVIAPPPPAYLPAAQQADVAQGVEGPKQIVQETDTPDFESGNS